MTQFLGFKDRQTKQKWKHAALQALTYEIWERTARPLSDEDVLALLTKRYPDGVPQGRFTLRLVCATRNAFLKCSNNGLHQVGAKKWCACADGKHSGTVRVPRSPILVFLDGKLRSAGVRVVDVLT